MTVHVVDQNTFDQLPEAKDCRARISIRPDLTAMTNEVIDAIAKRPEWNIYVRGRALVTLARDGSTREKWLARAPGAPVIVRLDQARMLAVVDLTTRWTKFNAKTKRDQTVFPVFSVVQQVLSRLEWPLPYLEGVIEAPTIRLDGSILSVAGYDEATGLLFEPAPGGGSWPAVPDRPSQAEIVASVNILLEPVKDFPFVTETDRAAYVAAVLTLLARHLIDGPVPCFPIRAPAPGTGKGLIAAVIAIIGTGREPAVMGMAEGDELRKRITAIALAGTPLVMLDNVSGSMGSDVLAMALTARSWTDRILGASETIEVPLRAVWIATGNNLGFTRTLGRRVIPIDLDARLEAPEDRDDFKIKDLPAYVRRERTTLVTAALTILRGFHVAGRPRHRKGARMGSFESWDDVVRSAVIWAGLEDPASASDPTRGRGRIRALADDDVADFSQLLEELVRVFGSTEWTAQDAWKRVQDDASLRAACDLAASRGTRSKVATLGSFRYALRTYAGRPIASRTLVRSDPSAREQKWKIEFPDTGVAGTLSPKVEAERELVPFEEEEQVLAGLGVL